MNERYFAKVVKVIDKHTIVVNAGADKDLKVGKQFLIVGLGEAIVDPDTKESLGQLEVVRGKARVTHVQERIATLKSAEYEKQPDFKEIKKVSTAGKGGLANIFGPQETVTESIKPAEPVPKPFVEVMVGDLAIEA
ncbi:hypothetical protein [Roseateles noduli]|uniref:hypothetical protein n=1 Tax=Roseateles noduli TaxID=2052484 RepID=UPI003D6519BE